MATYTRAFWHDTPENSGRHDRQGLANAARTIPTHQDSYLENFLNDGSPTNKIADILSVDRAEDGSANWRGLILFVAKHGVDREPPEPSHDLQVSDLRHIVDWMQCLKRSFKEVQYLIDRGYPGVAELLDE
jgi:hypothetical protein